MALHYFKSITCVYSVMFSLQRRCMGVLCCYFRPKMFSPNDRVFSLLESVEGTTVCLEIPLQSPPPPGDRHLVTVYPPPPHPRTCRALTKEIARGAGG